MLEEDASPRSCVTDEDIPISTRYVLQYSLASVEPSSLSVIPLSIFEHCCDSRREWSDPHLAHRVHVVCSGCKLRAYGTSRVFVQPDNVLMGSEDGQVVFLPAPERNPPTPVCPYLTASQFTDIPATGRYHIYFTCFNNVCENTRHGSMKILRRANDPKLDTMNNKVTVLDVELTGPFSILTETSISDFGFTVACGTHKNQPRTYETILAAEDPNKRVIGYQRGNMFERLGVLTGFRGKWIKCDWNSRTFDQPGSNAWKEEEDVYNATKEDYPPNAWKN